MKTSVAWLPVLLLIAAAVCAGESPAPEKLDADTKAKAEEEALQKRVEEVLKVFGSGDETAIKELHDNLIFEGIPSAKIVDLAISKATEKTPLLLLARIRRKLMEYHPCLGIELSILDPKQPVTVFPSNTKDSELSLEGLKQTLTIRYAEFTNNCDFPVLLTRPRDGSPYGQEYPYYQLEFLDQSGAKIPELGGYDLEETEGFKSTDFIRLEPGESWGKMLRQVWPRPPKAGKYKMRLRYVMPKADHKCADEAAKKLAEEASIGEVFSNTVDIEFVFPSKEELKKMGVVQDEAVEKTDKEKKDE